MKHKKHSELRMKSIKKAKHHSKQIGKAGSGDNNKHTAVQGFHLPWGSPFSENPNISNILQLEEEIVLVEPCSHFHSHNCSLCSHASMKSTKILNRKPKSQKKANQKTPKYFHIKWLSKFAMGVEGKDVQHKLLFEKTTTQIFCIKSAFSWKLPLWKYTSSFYIKNSLSSIQKFST